MFGSTESEKEEEIEKTLRLGEEDELVYLSFGWWFVNVGWKEVMDRVRVAVEEVMAPFVPVPIFISSKDRRLI